MRVGVVGAEESLSARSLPLPLNELILGGEGARVEEECWALVKSLEIEAVAVDVAASAGGGGLRGSRNLGGGGRRSGASTTTHASSRVDALAGCSCKILRSDSTVNFARTLSEESDDDDTEDSSVGGVMHRRWVGGGGGGEGARLGVLDRDR